MTIKVVIKHSQHKTNYFENLDIDIYNIRNKTIQGKKIYRTNWPGVDR